MEGCDNRKQMSTISKLASAYHNLAVLLDAGVPILRSLDTVTEGLQGNLKRAFRELRASASDGNTLAESMARRSNVFAELDVMLVETAETAGKLPESFNMLSDWYGFRNRMTRLILSGLLLPLLVLNIAAFVAPLPRFILGGLTLGGYLFESVSILACIYVPAGIIVVVLILSRKTAELRRIVDIIALRIPLLGKGIWQLSICRYCRAFNMLHKAGVPITECLSKATAATGNSVVSELFRGGAVSAAAGNVAHEGFSRELPSEYLDLWRVGEESGELDKTVDKIAEIAGDRAEHLLKQFGLWLPRFVYVLVCVILIMQIFKLAATMLGYSSGGF